MSTTTTTTTSTGRSRWPLGLLALPAAVAIWSGWVGLGQMAGFGLVHPLPGIADGFELNSAITLPIGVEAYSAYALGTWLSARTIPATARRFAAWSSLAALGLGLLGQIVYHLLTAAGHQQAPVAVVVFVACLPVLVLGAGAALHHLLGDPATPTPDRAEEPPAQVEPTPPAPVVEPAGVPGGPVSARRTPARPSGGRGKRSGPRRLFADYLNQARTQLTADTDPTPAWCRRVTGCSAGTSVKLAATLRETAPALAAAARLSPTTPTDAETHAGSGTDRKERAA
ncbi:MAG: hypothetical protein ACR2G2_06195 [Pseudonocardia sp.]